ncbi:FadR/GntR family transcriptional regulator [Streptomyces sp. NPDC057600]|uniref:FadR/GntR family transcriptional regulator n=1 Tax=Streptomyces sp. NPDC057600 TaxID=3346180 RepID=UPI003694DBB7
MTGSSRPASASASATSETETEAAPYRPGYEVAAERILEYVARQGMGPGDRLPTEKDLAAEVDMSRTVVREGVKILSALGRLSVEKGRGIFVAHPRNDLWSDTFSRFLPTDPSRVGELFEFRRFTEAETSGLAATRATPVQLRAIREAAQRSAEAAERDDHESFGRADAEFHQAIGAAAGNAFLSSLVDAIQRLQRQVTIVALADSAPGSLAGAAEQHLAILEAIGAGEQEQAAALMARHIDTTELQVQREIRNRIFAAPAAPADRDGA